MGKKDSGGITYRTRGKCKHWEYRFEGSPVNGKRNTISKGGFKTKAECVAAATEVFNRYKKTGTVVVKTNLSVSDFMDFWYDNYVVLNCRESSCEKYKGVIENHIKPTFGKMSLQAVTAPAIQNFIDKKKQAGLAKKTTQFIYSILKSSFKYACDVCDYFEVSPCNKTKMPNYKDNKALEDMLSDPKNGKGHYYIERDVYNDILNFITDPKAKLLLEIGYKTGMRISEILGLTWDNVDFEKKILIVDHQLGETTINKIKGKRNLAFLPPKTPMSNRVIFIPDTLIDSLKAYKAYQDKLLESPKALKIYAASVLDNKGDSIYLLLRLNKDVKCDYRRVYPIFTVERSKCDIATRTTFNRMCKLIKDNITPYFDFHSLRHTHATMLAEENVNPVVVQQRLGHSNINITLQYYTHISKKLQEQAKQVVNALYNYCGHVADKTAV